MPEQHADPHQVSTIEQLRELYDAPNELVLKTKLDFVHDYMIHFMSLAPIVAIASETEAGLDCSPRGGAAGFVKVLDRRTVAFGDWPGNNKLETISNIIRTGRAGLLFLVPKLDIFLRINGPAIVTRDPDVLQQLEERSRLPKTAVKISVEEAYFHCGKAIRRSGLWRPEGWPDTSEFPTAGKMMADLAKIEDMSPEELEAMYQHGLKEELY